MKLFIKDASQPVRLLNEGYWGMNIVKGGNYFLRSIIRTSEDYHGTVSVKLLSEDGTVLASEILDITTDGQWNDVRETLTAVGQDTRARLALEFDAPGTIWVDYVSLFPENTFNNRPNGLRRDVADMLVGLRPSFFRWPGGCVVEGITLDNRFEWKKLWEIPPHALENIARGGIVVLMVSAIMKCCNFAKTSVQKPCMYAM